ncbi:MAG: HEAT repeat domain-containing protein [Planctomycetaceae bacterium]|nr:HEAT repeat domain-containing protein [Planctomycetaceae bacterium]
MSAPFLCCPECQTEVQPAMARCRSCGYVLNGNTPARERAQVSSRNEAERAIQLRIQKADGRIRSQCSGCGNRVKAPLELAGKPVRCPKCSNSVEMPGLDVLDQFQQTSSGAQGDNLKMLLSASGSPADDQDTDGTSFELTLTSMDALVAQLKQQSPAASPARESIAPESLAAQSQQTEVRSEMATRQDAVATLPSPGSGSADNVVLGDVPESQQQAATARPIVTVRATCSACSLEISAPAQFAGVTVPCESCGAAVRFPERTLAGARSSADNAQSHSSGVAGRRGIDLLRAIDRALSQPAATPERHRPIDIEELSSWTTRGYLKSIRQACKADTSENLLKARQALKALALHGEIDARSELFKLYETAEGGLKSEILCCLASLRHPECFAPLIRTLGSASADEVLPLARALAELGDARAVLPLLFASDACEPHRERIHDALVSMEGAAGNEMCRIVMKSEDRPLLRTIAGLLGRFSGACPVKTLSKLLKDDHDEVREEAARSLAKLADGTAVKLLTRSMRDKSETVRVFAAQGFSRCDTEEAVSALMKFVGDPAPAVRRQVLLTLGACGKAIAMPAVRRRVDDADPECRIAAAEALGRLGDPQGLTLLLNMLKEQPLSSETGLALPIAQAIGRMKDPRGTVPLLNLLSTDDVALKEQIAVSLGEMKQRAARESLERLLTHDHSDRVRAAAAKALGELGDIEARPALERALRDSAPVKMQAIPAIVKLKGRVAETVRTLLPILEDQRPLVRCQALIALRELGDQSAATPVIPLILDPHSEVHKETLATLRALGEKRSEDALIKVAQKKNKKAALPTAVQARSAQPARPVASGGISRFSFGQISEMVTMLSPASLVGAVAHPFVMGGLTLTLLLGVGIWIGWNPETLGSGLPVVRGSVASVAVSEDGKFIAAGRTRGVLEIWDVAQQKVIASVPGMPSRLICFGPGAKNLLCAQGKRMSLIPFDSGKLGEAIPVDAHSGTVVDMKVTPDHRFAVTLGTEGNIIRWDLEAGRPVSTIAVKEKLGCIAISADGHELVGSKTNGELFLWDMDSQEQIASVNTRVLGIRSLAIQADGPLVAAGGGQGEIALWDPAKPGSVQVDTSSPAMVRALSFPAGGRLYAARGAKVELRNVATGDQVVLDTSLETISTLSVDQAGQLVSVGNEDESPVLVFDGGSGKLVHSLDKDL